MQISKLARRTGFGVAALCLGLALDLGGCGSSGGGGGAISSDPLSGKIGGQPWTLVTAQTDSFLSSATQYAVDA